MLSPGLVPRAMRQLRLLNVRLTRHLGYRCAAYGWSAGALLVAPYALLNGQILLGSVTVGYLLMHFTSLLIVRRQQYDAEPTIDAGLATP